LGNRILSRFLLDCKTATSNSSCLAVYSLCSWAVLVVQQILLLLLYCCCVFMFVAVHSSVLLYFALMLSPHYNNCIIPSLCCDRRGGCTKATKSLEGSGRGAKKEPHIAKPHTATPLQWLRAVPPYKKAQSIAREKEQEGSPPL
jgi:hypothetical protein